jgi:hypothetical protein
MNVSRPNLNYAVGPLLQGPHIPHLIIHRLGARRGEGALIRQDTYQLSRSKNRYPVCVCNSLRLL